MKALEISGYCDTIVEVATIAEKLCSHTSYDVLVGGSLAALLATQIAIGNEFSLKEIAKKILNPDKWLFFWKKPVNIPSFYTEQNHHQLKLSMKQVYVPLLNLTTKRVEYFNLASLCYKQAVLVLSAAVLFKNRTIKINGHVYLDGTILQNCTFWYLSNYRYIDYIDVVFPRFRKMRDIVQWVPKNKNEVWARLFNILRCEASADKAEYEIRIISDARGIVTNFYYLQDLDDSNTIEQYTYRMQK